MIFFERGMVFVLVLFLVTGCNNGDTSVSPVASSASSVGSLRERTYEERRDEAAAKIAMKKNEVKDDKIRVDLTPLAGRNLSDLFTSYLGIQPGPVPAFVDVSFDERMAYLYHEKVIYKKCTTKKRGEVICKVASDTVLDRAPGLLQRFIESDKMKMNLKSFIDVANEKAVIANKTIDWARLCKLRIYHLDAMRCKTLKDIMGNVYGRDLIAYGMTELLPSKIGSTNTAYLDIMLRNAGAQFLYHAPSLGDRYASLGLYQFTFLALREDPLAVEGTNIVNSMVTGSGEKIKGSVIALFGHEHHTAAFYFAVHNVAGVLGQLNNKQAETLSKIHHTHQDEMVIMIACAHHNPKYTRQVIARWLDVKAKPAVKQKGKKQVPPSTDIVPMFPKKADLNMYAIKSRNNLIAMYNIK